MGPTRVPLIQLSDTSKTFPSGRRAISGISLTIEEGEWVSIIGRSGCGKTTLLRLIAGLIEPSSGTLSVEGRAPGQSESVSFLFQEPTLMPWLKTRDNIALPLRIRGLPQTERQVAAEAAAARVGLSDALDVLPCQLSGGMKMRASLARALVTTPRILLLDEPFGSLDTLTRHDLNQELSSLYARDRWTGILVTHSITEAAYLSTRIVVLGGQPGQIHRIVESPLPRERSPKLREDPRFLDLVARLHHEIAEADKRSA